MCIRDSFGLALDADANRETVRGREGRIDVPTPNRPALWVIPTDEEGRIADETRQLLGETPR